ncbi:Rho family GTPase Rho1 [Gigaspora margarita]|uniref:Rho family GTPase Rho1 n=1 Tax=Gigaspora margarita TaxID=4874 RepID=A0A8H3WUZ6_GIGMA|nr:Rho family GTPase Rho1 [Gigaspora margarita]
MDLDPQKRPFADEIWNILGEWNDNMESSDNTSKIKNQFLDADKIVKTLPLNLPKHSDFMYTSKIINTKKILIEINASRSMDFVEMPNDL